MSGAGGGYPSDLTDEQWALVEPLLPLPRVGPKGGRREKHPRRRIVDAIFYVVRTGCAWRQLPKDFAPWPTVYWYFTWWHDDGTVERIHDALRCKVREADGRNAEPSAGLIDSQSVRTADTVPVATRGFDAGKKVKGRKRFMVGGSHVAKILEWVAGSCHIEVDERDRHTTGEDHVVRTGIVMTDHRIPTGETTAEGRLVQRSQQPSGSVDLVVAPPLEACRHPTGEVVEYIAPGSVGT